MLAAQAEVGFEQALDGGRAGRTLEAEVGTVAVIDEVAEVRRADHVEVQVGLDLLLLFRGEVLHVVGRAHQAGFLGAPPGEAHLVDRQRLGQQHGHLQLGGAARTVVVDTGAFEHRVEVRADHHHVVRVAATGLGDHVVGLGLLAYHIDHQVQLQVRGLRPGHAVVVGGEDHRDAALVGLAYGDVLQALAVVGVALVEDDHPGGAGGRGVLGLLLEVAGAALDQRDRAGREVGEVFRLATAGGGVAGAEGQVHRDHLGGDVACLGLRQVGEILLPFVADRLRHGGAQATRALRVIGGEREGLHADLVAGFLQGLLHVVDGGLVARRGGGAIAVVETGDVLQLLQALDHVAGLQAARQAERGADQQRRFADRRVGFAGGPELGELLRFRRCRQGCGGNREG